MVKLKRSCHNVGLAGTSAGKAGILIEERASGLWSGGKGGFFILAQICFRSICSTVRVSVVALFGVCIL